MSVWIACTDLSVATACTLSSWYLMENLVSTNRSSTPITACWRFIKYTVHLHYTHNRFNSRCTLVSRISVGAQSTLVAARHFCPKNSRILHYFCAKNLQNTRNFMTFARKVNKISEFHVIFARIMPEFYIIIARKIFFRIFFLGGGGLPPASPRLLRLYS